MLKIDIILAIDKFLVLANPNLSSTKSCRDKVLGYRMKKITLSLFFSLFCGVILLLAATELFSQRGMNVIVRTESGEELALYKDSYALVIGNGDYPAKNGWNPLPGAVNDAKEVTGVLERHGFNVTLKIDVTKQRLIRLFQSSSMNLVKIRITGSCFTMLATDTRRNQQPAKTSVTL